jgi:hypothetical protein
VDGWTAQDVVGLDLQAKIEAEASRRRDIERWETEVAVKEKELAAATQQLAERYLSRGAAGGSEEVPSGEGLQENREVTEWVEMEEVPYEEAETHREDEEGDVEDEGGSSGTGPVEAEADVPLFLTSVNHARLRRVSKLKRLSLLPSSQPALAFKYVYPLQSSSGVRSKGKWVQVFTHIVSSSSRTLA